MNDNETDLNLDKVKDILIELGEVVCATAREQLVRTTVEERTRVVRDGGSDVIYEFDQSVEELVVETLERHAEDIGGVVLIAEGIGEYERTVFPKETTADQAALRILMDPIDGTRALMYDKRSGFFLAGVAPNLGDDTRLRDIELAVMVEIPTSRAALGDTFWAVRGKGVEGYTRDLHNGLQVPVEPAPSREESIEGGFTQFSRFFPPGMEWMARIEEALLAELFPEAKPGHILTFEDQYIASSGQLFEMLKGRDRLCVDVRARIYEMLKEEGKRISHVCHPYDLAAHLIGEESGLIITDAYGNPLDAPMDTLTPMDWIAYANEAIREQVQPVLDRLLRKHGAIKDAH